MNEWASAAPIVVETDPEPNQPRTPSARRRRLPRWAVGLIIALAILMVWSGALLLIFKQQYTMLQMLPVIALLAAGEIVVVLLIYPIAWRRGRLI